MTFNLSEKRKEIEDKLLTYLSRGTVKDIMNRIDFQDKEFIRLLKEELYGNNKSFVSNLGREKIDKLAGEDLI